MTRARDHAHSPQNGSRPSRRETEQATRLAMPSYPACLQEYVEVLSPPNVAPRTRPVRHEANPATPSAAQGHNSDLWWEATVAAVPETLHPEPSEAPTRLQPDLASREQGSRRLLGTRAHLLTLCFATVLAASATIAWQAQKRTAPEAPPAPAEVKEPSSAAAKRPPEPAPDRARPAAPSTPEHDGPMQAVTPSEAAAHLSAGRHAAALQAYRALAHAHPDDPVYTFIANELARNRAHAPSSADSP